MKAIRIIVVSPETAITSFLYDQLPPSDFDVIGCNPGDECIVRMQQVQIAIIDRINERPDTARREIALLKKNHPGLPVIAISKHSSDRDASIVQQGIFYYLAGYSEQKLLRVILAAADTIGKPVDK